MNISELPEPYKSLALQRVKEGNDDITSVEFSGDYLFYWKTTPEGHHFWQEVKDAKHEGQLPKHPLQTYAEKRSTIQTFKFC